MQHFVPHSTFTTLSGRYWKSSRSNVTDLICTTISIDSTNWSRRNFTRRTCTQCGTWKRTLRKKLQTKIPTDRRFSSTLIRVRGARKFIPCGQMWALSNKWRRQFMMCRYLAKSDMVCTIFHGTISSKQHGLQDRPRHSHSITKSTTKYTMNASTKTCLLAKSRRWWV